MCFTHAISKLLKIPQYFLSNLLVHKFLIFTSNIKAFIDILTVRVDQNEEKINDVVQSLVLYLCQGQKVLTYNQLLKFIFIKMCKGKKIVLNSVRYKVKITLKYKIM